MATFINKDGKQVTVNVGDYVSFKCDIEQCGRVTAIAPGYRRGDYRLTVTNENGFDGGYIGGQRSTQVESNETYKD